MGERYLIATGKYFFYEECPCCKGSGRTPNKNLGGYYIDYHYQDGHEQSGPMTKEKAILRVQSNKDPSCVVTLIGPDGQIYTLE